MGADQPLHKLQAGGAQPQRGQLSGDEESGQGSRGGHQVRVARPTQGRPSEDKVPPVLVHQAPLPTSEKIKTLSLTLLCDR